MAIAPSLQARSPLSALPAARDHFVQFYERDPALTMEVARYLRHGVEGGCAAIAITTPEHLAAIRAHWRDASFDPAPFEQRGQLVVRDAADTLPYFMRDGAPDPARFDAVVGRLVRDALAGFGQVVIFGEMVSLLFEQGRQTAATQVEDLWNRLAQELPFTLFCAYPMRQFADSGTSDAFRHVCAAHAHLVPSEAFRAASEEDQLRMVVDLQQKAASLARELAMRKSAEERLAERERELADFVENAVVGLHRVGPDGTILWANDAELRMLGYERDEYVGHNIAEFHGDEALLRRILAQLASGRALREQEATMRCKDGSLRHVVVNSNALIRDGRLVHTRCFTRDVTDRWRAQEAMRERTAILHLALQGSRAGYWVGDLESGRIRCSAELAALVGIDGPFEGSWEEFHALAHPEDRHRLEGAIEEAIETRGRVRVDLRLGSDGAWHRFELRGEPVFDEAGRPVRFYGLCLQSAGR